MFTTTHCAASPSTATALPDGFVYLTDLAPTIVLEVRYASANNFVGRPIRGYQAPVCILTREAAQALARVQDELLPIGLSLKVFDCYRPQQAVNDFVQWSQDLSDQARRADYYPTVPKSELFARGYIAKRSGHSRGSTVDLTVISTQAYPAAPVAAPTKPGAELEMGSSFDFFDERSHTDHPSISAQAKRNRQWFKTVMEKHGFDNYPQEWWHYTLRDEPHPARYFDFPVR